MKLNHKIRKLLKPTRMLEAMRMFPIINIPLMRKEVFMQLLLTEDTFSIIFHSFLSLFQFSGISVAIT